MKKTIGILAGIATLGVGVYVTSHLGAQQPSYAPAAAPAPQSRMALINLGQVVKNYTKFKNFEAQLKTDSQWYENQLEERKTKITQLQAEINKPTVDNPTKEQYGRQIKQIQREMQDMSEDGKAKLSKKEFDQLVQTYREIRDAVTRYARANNIELVMHYNDGIGTDEFSPAIFPRKLANGACQPMYIAPGLDITGSVTEMLNKSVAAAPSGFGPSGAGN